MAQSQFALSWESYKSNICSGFSAFQQNGELVDMTLAADGHVVKVHQVLIALASPYLKQLITSVPSQHPVIFLNNVSYTTLTLILEYIYTGEVRVPADNLPTFMECAKALHVRGLESISQTDSGSTTSKRETENETNLENTSTKRKSDQIILPPNAKRIFVNINPDSSPIVSVDKPILISNTDDNIHDYSEQMDDTIHDLHYDDDGDTNSTVHTSSKNNHNTEITSTKTFVPNEKMSSNLQFTVSIRGALQVILNRYIYNLHSSQSSGVRRWRCIDYRNKKCSAFLTTKGNVVLNRANPHNHTFHDKKIIDKIEKNAVYSALDDIQGSEAIKEKKINISEDSELFSN